MASFRVALVAILALAPCVRAAHGSQSAGVASREKSLEAAWSLDSNSKVSPVQRVVALLGKMKAELEEEASSESGMYDKMVCWCETNEKEKTKAIADADAKDIELGGEVESRGARFGELSATIASLKAQVASDKAMLEQATAIREREAGEFRDEEKDLVQYVTNLKNAIAALSKHQLLQTDGKGSLLQVGSLDGQLVSGLRVLLRDAALKYELLLAERGSAPKRRVASLLSTAVGKASADSEILLSALDVHGSPVTDALPPTFAARIVERAAAAPRKGSRGAFLQAGDAQPLYESRSSARSAGIFGVLTQMMEEFESQLSQEQKDEMKGAADYAELKVAKEDQIAAGEKKLDEMEGQDAANQKALADAKEDLTMLREQRSKDVEFLQNLKITCGNIDTQWDRRSKTRAAELTAVAETIAILTEDDNREHLAKTVSFLQERSVSQAEAELAMRRSSAVGALRKAAASPDFEADDLLSAWRGRRSAGLAGASNGPRSQLSTLAVSVQLDTFTKVREMMDKMVASLKEEQEEEEEETVNEVPADETQALGADGKRWSVADQEEEQDDLRRASGSRMPCAPFVARMLCWCCCVSRNRARMARAPEQPKHGSTRIAAVAPALVASLLYSASGE
mmetsp:Transcript_2851/g.7387  ORF Transcript_2851/g.7387 Transcript_2851/m.7387 type:complete len:628 (-) Transcript_2851:388-2271(-)